MSYSTDNLSSQKIVSGICGVGIILFCESEYACLRLFKRKTTLFFFISQLAIWVSILMTILSTSIYFLPDLRVLSMLIFISIVIFTVNISYPIMILQRLKLIRNFSVIVMYTPVILAIILMALKYFWICWILTSTRDCFYAAFIIELITIILLTAEYIVINTFFIVMAIKRFHHVVRIRYAIIVNIIMITLCAITITGFVIIKQIFFILCIISMAYQIFVRLELEILSYIAKSVRQQSINNEEYIHNNLNLLEER